MHTFSNTLIENYMALKKYSFLSDLTSASIVTLLFLWFVLTVQISTVISMLYLFYCEF